MIITTGHFIKLRNITPSINNGKGMISINMDAIESYIEIEGGKYSKLRIITAKHEYIVECSVNEFEEKYFEFINKH